MSQPHQCDFLLMRYVPDAFRNEFVNIGVMLLSRDLDYADVRFTRDWARVLCMDPAADTDILGALEEDIRNQLRGEKQAAEKFVYRLQDTLSNTLQLSPPNALLSDSPEHELDQLARTYLERPRIKRQAKRGVRQKIFAGMQHAFEDAGVWRVLDKNVAVSDYTHGGDPLRIDCGYKPNGIIRLFHAVSLATEPDTAKVLAFSYPMLVAGIRTRKSAETELSAIVEDNLDDGDESIQFALETLRQSSIKTVPLNRMPEIAERARQELRL